VAAISMIFLRINLPTFVQFKQYQSKLGSQLKVMTHWKVSFESYFRKCIFERKLSKVCPVTLESPL